MSEHDSNNHETDWVEAIKARELTGMFRFLLDALAPLGPLSAQLLYVMQPISGMFGWRGAVGDLARALEDPDDLDALRRRLDE